jgi:DNA polymerase-3 subunit alpha
MYKAKMAEMSTYLKQNQPAMLLALNQSLTSDVREKYGSGSISKWEMDSISFYYHDHELSRVNYADYHLSNFFSLPLHAPVAYSFPDKRGGRVNVPQTSSLIGTVIDKNKIKRTVKLLTVDGVVNLKIWNTQFAKYDKQISEKGSDGKKHVVEKSWFKRGTLLLVTGVRRENNFVPKVNKTSAYEFPILKIVDVSETGELTFKLERDE